jgi:hypothetical protein
VLKEKIDLGCRKLLLPHPHAEDQVGKMHSHFVVQIGDVLQIHGVPISMLEQILGKMLLQKVLGVLLILKDLEE